MNIGQHIISNILNEKASIDWNNYLTPEEVEKFLSKDDKTESAEEIVYNTKGNFYQKYFDNFKKDGWTKRELTQNLANFYYNGNLNESYVLKGAQNGKGFDIAYNSDKEKLEKFKDEMSNSHPNIDMWIEENKLDESISNVWYNQIYSKSDDELEAYLNILYSRLSKYNDTNTDIKSKEFYDLLEKINYLEDILNIKPKLGRELK